LIRIVVPDFSIGIQWYLKNPNKLFDKSSPGHPPFSPETALGRLIAWAITPGQHRSAFDFDTIKWYLTKAKFINLKQMSFNKCNAVFDGKDKPRYASYSLYVEAQK